ncbi:hypothetical protein THAOC_20875 [Thalassiosira oceanica]|uniref:Uncharacterized protein n=1 Tax=Thalassiosira oceanica TaxID=159749 RepID=K0S2B2_THAOC|nr:hypothetical protein THAOC_20875 [Thalassiosira oceanica]|eukprot:EJK58964.1 hypothetical protein THAOC_20875 [Thalassiosira oceanica]
MGPSIDERVEAGRVSCQGATTAAGLDLPSVGRSNIKAAGYRVAESDETPVYEAEVTEPKAVLPLFYQRTGFVFVMVAMTLLATRNVLGVLPSNNFDKNTGGPKAPTGTLGQTAVNSLAPSSAPLILFGFGDFLQIGDWRLARTCETCSSSHLSISSQAHGMTSQIFRDDGTYLQGPRADYNGFDWTGGHGLTYSTQPIMFGFWAVQIRDWRIRQVDLTHLSVTNENDNVSRIYRSDGTVRGNVKEWGGYVKEDLGEPTCAFLTSTFLQLGEWRFGEMGANLIVTHKSGQTGMYVLFHANLHLMPIYLSIAMIYRDDGTILPGPRTDFNAWTLVDDEVLAGTKKSCNFGASDASAPSASPPPTSTNGLRQA